MTHANYLRGVFLAARDWQIEDTWRVAGLKGTGSLHITLRDTVVSAGDFLISRTAYHGLTARSALYLGWNTKGEKRTPLWRRKRPGPSPYWIFSSI